MTDCEDDIENTEFHIIVRELFPSSTESLASKSRADEWAEFCEQMDELNAPLAALASPAKKQSFGAVQ